MTRLQPASFLADLAITLVVALGLRLLSTSGHAFGRA